MSRWTTTHAEEALELEESIAIRSSKCFAFSIRCHHVFVFIRRLFFISLISLWFGAMCSIFFFSVSLHFIQRPFFLITDLPHMFITSFGRVLIWFFCHFIVFSTVHTHFDIIKKKKENETMQNENEWTVDFIIIHLVCITWREDANTFRQNVICDKGNADMFSHSTNYAVSKNMCIEDDDEKWNSEINQTNEKME